MSKDNNSMGELQQIIEQLVLEQIKDTDCFLVDITVSAARSKIQVFIDADKGIDIDFCAKLSRFLEKNIEERGLVGEKYLLEVSSPGIGNPFKVLRQYYKAIGRTVSVVILNNTICEGVLKEVSETTIAVLPQVRMRDKKKLSQDVEMLHIPIEQIKQIKEIIVF